MVVIVSPKGQITIPQDLREQLGIVPQMELDVACTADGRLVLAPKDGLSKAQRVLSRLRLVPHRGLSADQVLAMTRGEE
jgi:AbrB family looped-hinge helix DNA binding protein